MNHIARNDVKPAVRIIPREQHTISRKNISKAALRVLYRLNEAGYTAYLVGGAVRDLLLGGHPKDFDVATSATPDEVKKLFRNCRLIGRRFRLAHVVFGAEIIEVATFRGTNEESGEGDRHIVDGRIVRDNVWGSIEEDALRRDFRFNAMYYDISDFSVRDYVGGMQDLHDRMLRLIGDPALRYREDPVRMLRAARLAAKLNFAIDPLAAAPFAELGPLLTEVAPARLFDESLKLFLSGHGLKSFRMLELCGLLKFLFPATARALQRGDEALRVLVEQGLANTDARIAEGKSVTPAFLFAVLLWGEVRDVAHGWMQHDKDPTDAWARAAAQVVGEQCQRVAIPRRFTFTMEEIWSLQPRFEQIQRKKVFRLMTHPRFRAAYDFLLLRAAESPAMDELGQWWGHAQQLSHETLAEALPLHGGSADFEPKAKPGCAAAQTSSSQADRQGQFVLMRAYVALGSNLGDSRQQLLDAMDALDRLPESRVLARSQLYLTPPWGVREQPDFINAAVMMESALTPHELLKAMLSIEVAAGRIRAGQNWGPRTLDLDLLHVNGVTMQDRHLHLPHPRIAERAFVLLPLNELAPGLDIPGQGVVAELLAAVDTHGCALFA